MLSIVVAFIGMGNPGRESSCRADFKFDFDMYVLKGL